MKPNILFLVYKSKINTKGRCSLKCRVTYKKRRREFAAGFSINPKFWNNKKHEVTPKQDNFNFINSQLDLIRHKINLSYLFLQVNNAFHR